MNGEDQRVKVYEGEPGDIAFLTSLLISAGVQIVTAGHFFGSRELHVRCGDEVVARELVADFEASGRRGGGGDTILRGPWPKDR